MDLQSLSELFASSYNPDPNVQKSCELQIRKISNEAGLITALLQISATDSVDLATRQACAVWVKNRVKGHYSTSVEVDTQTIKPEDRAALKSSLMPLIASSPSRMVTAQFAHTLKTVVSIDFPQQWPTLTDDIKRLLHSGDIREVHAGCIGSLEAIRAFRFRQKNDYLPRIAASIFPSLVTIATNMLATPPSASQEIPTMLHLILKAYKTSIVVQLSKHQQSSESIVPWGRLLFAVVNLELPKEAVPEDEEEREKSEWWKAKKWAYGTLGRLFHRFGNPSQLPSTSKEEYGAFAQHFVTMFAPEILNMYLHQVELYVSGQAWLSKKCQYQIFSFFTECVKPKSTWALLKPHFPNLLEKFVFPQLVFSPAKQELWTSDPVEYIRLAVDEYESFTSPSSAATTFLYQMASNRAKTTFMPMMEFLGKVLQSQVTPQERFGALNMLAALGTFVLRHPDVQNVESFILQWVTPSLTAPEPYIRAIACEVVGTVTKSGLKFTTSENIQVNYLGVVGCLDDQEIPVKIQGALALTELIQTHEQVKGAVTQSVEKIVHEILKLSEETDLDILNHCMEVMVDEYQTELLPVAAQLTQRLCESYLRLVRETIAQEEAADTAGADIESLMTDADDDKTYAAMGVCKTIWTVVSSVDSSPDILAQIQQIIIPIVVYTLENKLLDLFSGTFDLVDTLTFKLRAIAPEMWRVFELTYQMFKSDAVDFLDEMLPSLDNFVSYGADVIASRPQYVQMLLDIYTTALTNEHLGENDQVNGCKLAESLLMNLRGRIDDILQPIIVTALDLLDKPETTALRLANLEVLVNAVLYNPVAALQLMDTTRPGAARVFFDRWFSAINTPDKLPRVHDKKLTIVTLCALLELQPAAVPDTLKEGWPAIVPGLLKVFKTLPAAIELRQNLQEQLEEDSDDDADEPQLDLRGDDEDVWDDESAYLEMLAKESARLRGNSDKLDLGEDPDDDSEDEMDIDEELSFISPLEAINPYAVFKQALTTFQMQYPDGYQASTTALDIEQQALLMEVMKIADEAPNAPPA